MSRKPAGKAARAAAARRSAAAVKGWQTRRRNERAAEKARRHRVEAAKHGDRARRRTAAKLTEAQREARRREARRVTQKIRRAKHAKKAGRNDQAIGASFRSKISPILRGRSKKSIRKHRPSTEHVAIAGKYGSGDRFAAQIAVRFQMPAGFKPTAALVREAIAYRIEHGEDAPRVKTKILRWRNPGRRHAEDRAWRQGNQGDAWETLGVVIRAAL